MRTYINEVNSFVVENRIIVCTSYITGVNTYFYLRISKDNMHDSGAKNLIKKLNLC